MQIVDNVVCRPTRKFKIVDSISVDNPSVKLDRREQQKIKNARIADLTREYNELCKETKGRHLTEDELERANKLMFEMREMKLFKKLVRM